MIVSLPTPDGPEMITSTAPGAPWTSPTVMAACGPGRSAPPCPAIRAPSTRPQLTSDRGQPPPTSRHARPRVARHEAGLGSRPPSTRARSRSSTASRSAGSGASARMRCPSAGRRQLQAPRVQEQPLQTVRSAARRARPVDGVAGDRVPDRVEMHADLVRPAGHEIELQERPAGQSLADPVAGDGRPAVGNDRHPRAVLRVPPDRRLDPADGRRQRCPRPARGRSS